MEFWLAVILRAPRALSQALCETLEGSGRLLDDVKEVLNLTGLPRGAAPCYATLFSTWWFLDAQGANRGRLLRPPTVQLCRFARVALNEILVELRTGRRGKHRFGATRKHWKSLAHGRSDKKILKLS